MALCEQLKNIKQIALNFAREDIKIRDKILSSLSYEIEQQKEEIQEANLQDQKIAQDLLNTGELNQSLFKRLTLNDQKIAQLKLYPDTIFKLADPLKKISYHCELDDGLNLIRETCPLGTLGIIFESRPEVVIQISCLAIKTGNAVILKGGSECKNTNFILANIVKKCLGEFGYEELVTLLESREEVNEMLQLDSIIDLLIPRGSNEFVKYIQKNSSIPVLGHSEGLCHLFIDESANHTMAQKIVLDAKTDYVSACNTIETLIVHQDFDFDRLLSILKKLISEGVELRVDHQLAQKLKGQNIHFKFADKHDWKTEYCDLILSIKLVATIDEAIDFINKYGSKHTEAILTENKDHWIQFSENVDAAAVFWNASNRFCDGFVFGLGAEVGISTNKIHARGPVGLEGILTYKYKLIGQGHIKSDYVQNKTFKHRQRV